MGQIHARAWLVASVDRMKKDDLQSLVQSLPGDFAPYPRDALKTCDAMRAYITLARRYYYQDHELKRRLAQALERAKPVHLRPVSVGRAPGKSLCSITASECNDWLRSLPIKEPQ